MQVEFHFDFGQRSAARETWLHIGGSFIKLLLVRHRRAKRYVLRLSRDGTARVTVPQAGTLGFARQFAQRHASWLQRQILRQAQNGEPRAWQHGTEIQFRGSRVRLELDAATGSVSFADHHVRVSQAMADLRPVVEAHLSKLASAELPARVRELAALHQFEIGRVSVRNQRSRWGSCSRRGTISLNWRLIQAPLLVRDYIILHELAHLKHMNHSRRFWREVARLCPSFEEAEVWLKQNSGLLRPS